MFRILTTFLVLALLTAPASARSKVSKHTLLYGDEERTYYLYAPKTIPEEGMPLLLTFHGSGRDGASLVEKWTKLANKHGFLVAGLDAANTQHWDLQKDGPPVRSLVAALQEEFPILDRQIYLFGHSAGAVFTLMTSLMDSEFFAAAAVHAGSFRDPSQHNMISLATREIPIKIIVGDRDKFFSVASVESTAAGLREHGIPVEVEIIKGHDHWYYDRAQSFNKSAWLFLSSHQLATDPQFAEYAY